MPLPPAATAPTLDPDAGGADRVRARLRACFDRSPLPQLLLHPHGRVVSVNRGFCDLTGRPAPDVVGVDARTLLPDLPTGALDALLSGPSRVEAHLVDGRGRPLPVLVDAVAVEDGDGALAEVCLLLHDLRTVREAQQRQAQQEDFFLALSQRASDLALVGDADGVVVYASPAVRHVFGHGTDDVVGREGWDFVHPDDVAAARAAYAAVVQHGGSASFVLRVRAGDGCWRWVEQTATNLLHTAVGGIVCNLSDVTERAAAEQSLRASEARFRAIAETAEEGVWAVAPDGTTLFANARLAAILGRTVDDLYAHPAADLFAPEDVDEVSGLLRDRERLGTGRYEMAYPHPDGAQRRLWIAASPLIGADGEHTGSLAMVTDVTDARRNEEQLRRAALHDALTDLPNRTLLADRLEQALTRQQAAGRCPGTALVMIGLDHFRLVNESQGHGTGDELLLAVAQRLRAQARPADTVARFGGDQFAVVLEDVDERRARTIAEELLAALREPFDVEGRVLHVGASVGLAVTPAGGDDLLRFADVALHAAKAAGRGTVVAFDRSHADQVERRYALAADLRTALEQDRLCLHYQPVVALETGRVVAVEALARWWHPELGEVPPGRFVEVAELTGMALLLDAWAVQTALRETADLRERGVLGADVAVAVNLSALSLASPQLEDDVVRALEATGTPAHLVVLEITESAVMHDAERAVRTLQRLRARGLRVAVDDFGTGHSSLAYLRDLPVTSLKVDRSFVAGIVQDRDALAIVASVVDLARALDVEVVAEGVETPEQAAVLRRLGCTTAQGWLWSAALPVEQVEQAGATWRAGYPVGPARPGRPVSRPGERWEVRPEHGSERLLELHRGGASLTTVAAALNSEGYRTPTGARWHRTTVARTVAQAAYPELSGAR